MAIPKIIHQIWLQGYDNIPDKYKLNMKKTKDMNKDWNHVLWDDLKIINLLRENKEWIDTYYKLEYLHHKVDFSRYVILYKYGGIYIDMDAYTIKSLDGLLNKFRDYDLILSKSKNKTLIESYLICGRDTCLNNGIIISSKGSEKIKILIDSIIKNPKCDFLSIKQTCINSITGPKKITNVVYDNMNNKTKLLDPEYLEPCVNDKCELTENTYIVHKHALSWFPDIIVKWDYKEIFIVIIMLLFLYINLWYRKII
jgi:mannosyltransferase OCH1-like enzyme